MEYLCARELYEGNMEEGLLYRGPQSISDIIRLYYNNIRGKLRKKPVPEFKLRYIYIYIYI